MDDFRYYCGLGELRLLDALSERDLGVTGVGLWEKECEAQWMLGKSLVVLVVRVT